MVTIQILHQIIFTTLLERKSCQNYGQNSVSPHWSVFVRLKVVIGIGMFFFNQQTTRIALTFTEKTPLYAVPLAFAVGNWMPA